MKAKKPFTYLLCFVLVSLFAFSVQAAEPVRIGQIDPFSGPVAAVGLEGQDNYKLAIERINARGAWRTDDRTGSVRQRHES